MVEYLFDELGLSRKAAWETDIQFAREALNPGLQASFGAGGEVPRAHQGELRECPAPDILSPKSMWFNTRHKWQLQGIISLIWYWSNILASEMLPSPPRNKQHDYDV